ncbi:hypothetical protein NQ318_019758 [Aromia moschata]|uniref:Calcium uniporter protein n=1 Tax=Aromia moschata TaxID=1265417 RepID=A0AAV8YJ03_9CUCU|nr:hypothetical protein NQ318_019758 [Aromia moschata]
MVPKLLTPEQKESRMNICADILNNIDTDPGLLDAVNIFCPDCVRSPPMGSTDDPRSFRCRLNDVKTLVNQLYEALHVQEHQLTKEKELTAQLEMIQQELLPLEETKNQLELVAQRRGNWLSWAGLGLMSVQFGILARLTWWEYSWDIMEPVTYFVTYGTAMACYAYFVLTREVRI